MSTYQANVKVKPPTKWVGLNAVFDRSQLHHINNDSRAAPPAPCSRMGGHAQNEGTPTTSAVHAFGNEHSGASLNAKGAALGRCDSEPKLVQGAAPGRGYIKENNQGVSR